MEAPAQARSRLWDVARLVLNVLVFVVAILALREGLTFRPRAAYFPVAAAGIVAVGTAAQMCIDLTNFAKGRPIIVQGMDVSSAIHEKGAHGLLLALRYIAWFVGFIAVLNIGGVFVAAVVFIAAFLKVEARWRWKGVLIAAVLAAVSVYVMIGWLGLEAPPAYFEIGHELL